MPSLRSLKRFRLDNGNYALLSYVATRPIHWIRNRFLAATFGVQGICVGPGAVLRGVRAISIGENFMAGAGLWIEAVSHFNEQLFTPRIIIGKNVVISSWSHIAATHCVEIGDGVLIGSNVMIADHNHGFYRTQHTSPTIPPNLRPLDCDRRVVIQDNVWLGNGVVVCPDAEIGEGSVVGANSVVRGVVPPFTMAAGAPARVLKQYDFETASWNSWK